MKRIALPCCLLLAAALTAGAVEPPLLVDYQAEVTGPGGAPLDGPTDFVFRFFDAAEGGNEIAIDHHLASGTGAVLADDGLVNVKLGAGHFVDGSGPGTYDFLDLVLRDHAALWLQVEIAGEVLQPRVRVTSSAYAINATMLQGRSLLEWELDTEQRIGVHAGDVDAHHARYTDADAVAAMGPQADGNPLHHARPDAAEIVAAVAASPLVPGSPCTGDDAVLRWTGSAWICEALAVAGPSDGNANGFEAIDPWGEAFDGIQRTATSWTAANAQCAALGGNLPTVTELHRNNAATGSGSIADANATAFLWTRIADAPASERVTVRLSDGAVASAAEGAAVAYRCVWPDAHHPVFTDDACHGPPGAGCDVQDLVHNMDSWDRPPLRFAAAVNECNAYNASLPDVRRMQEAIQAGLSNPTSQWLWAGEGKYWYTGGFGATLARFDASPQEAWYFTSGSGATGATTSALRFRCIGRGTTSIGVLPASPPCTGGCTAALDRASPVYADSTDRTATDQASAAADCAAQGGSLPHLDEFADLVRAGWPAFPDLLWTSDPAYAYDGTYGFDTYRQGAMASARWQPDASTATVSVPASPRAYRCIWRTRIEASPTTCAGDQAQVWTGAGYACVASIPGDAGGNANQLAYTDDWGNQWDLQNRAAASWDVAKQTCEAIGARLPLPGEAWRVRYNAEVGTALGGTTDTSYLWTAAPHSTVGARTRLRLSDGASAPLAATSTSPYRCIWPSTTGDAFGGRACHGEPAEPCQQAGGRRWDRYDRPAVSQPAAAYECAFLGGRLPNLDDFQTLVAAGAPNGSNQWLWIAESMYWYSGNYGYALGRWSGTGTAAWTYTNLGAGYGALGLGSQDSRFRCTFGDGLE